MCESLITYKHVHANLCQGMLVMYARQSYMYMPLSCDAVNITCSKIHKRCFLVPTQSYMYIHNHSGIHEGLCRHRLTVIAFDLQVVYLCLVTCMHSRIYSALMSFQLT